MSPALKDSQEGRPMSSLTAISKSRFPFPTEVQGTITTTPALEQPHHSSSQLDHFKKILQHSNATARNDVHAHPTTIPDVPGSTPAALPEVADSKLLRTYLKEHKAAVIGGITVRDIHLLVGDISSEGSKSRVQSRDLPVLPFQVPESNGVRAQLKSSQLDPGAMPVLVFPEEYITLPGFEKVETLPQAVASFGQVNTTFLDVYTVSGDIANFWNVKGLTAKLYKHKAQAGAHHQETLNEKHAIDNGANQNMQSATEKVILNAQSLAFKGKPLASLFPFIASVDIKNLPIANLELTYSADKSNNSLHKPGLRLEVDVELKGNLQWVGDAMKTLFGSSTNTPIIHLTA
ncbi:hypothetical protein MFIFM68171_08912 [Madurella fahalii]|uniref:Uncharacterized protein n=1 Tax=Madurella fahalii TaxID=1157608 RepID=A0ABQ0GLQ8_9PEZI